MVEPGCVDRRTLDTLLDSVGGDLAFLHELVQEYLDDAPRQFLSMHQALSANDCEAFRRAAHSLKSNSATFGASALASMCRDLEYMGRDEVLEGADARIAAAEVEFVGVQQALRSAAEG